MEFLTLKRAALWLTIASLAVLLAACEKKNELIEPPPPPVTIAQPVQRNVIEHLEFTGTTSAFEKVEVRARVPGFLQSIAYKPGTEVKQGDLLFVIDPREYAAELAAAEAELESAKAQFERAETELGRAQRLFEKQAGSESDVVKWRGERDIAKATIARAEAQFERAKLNLGYTQVTTPISGRADRNLVDIGNLVGEGEPTLLTTVTAINPMYVYFNLNELDLLRTKEMYRQKIEKTFQETGQADLSEVEAAEIPLYLGLANEEGYPHEGMVDYGDSSVDPGTGTIQLRGIFPNEDTLPILPGLFVRIRMPVRELENALLVSERAISSDQGGPYLLVVNSENVVGKRPITLGQLESGMQVIKKGLEPGEWVIVNGLQRARPGAKVTPQKTDMTAQAANESAQDDSAGPEDEQPAETPAAEKPEAAAETVPADQAPADDDTVATDQDDAATSQQTDKP